MTIPDSSVPQFPMRVVVRRTGLSASLLRAWERRYGAVRPGRSDGGQRLYSEDDIHKLLLLKDLVDGGHSIGQVAGHSPAELRVLLRRSEGDGRSVPSRLRQGPATGGVARDAGGGADMASQFLDACMAAAHEMDARLLESQLNRAAMALNPVTLVDRVLVPLLNRIGLLWAKGELGPASEHVASAAIRRFLDWLLDTLTPDGDGPIAAVGTPAGHRHEFGALLASVVVAGEGWRLLTLGPDLPADEIAEAVQRKSARLVALSAIYPREDPQLLGELRTLRRGISDDILIFVGGPAAGPYADALRDDGVSYLPDLQELRKQASIHLPGSRR